MSINPNSFEFQLLLALTIVLLISKLILSIYLLREVYIKKKETGKITLDFTLSFFVMMTCLFVSRLLYMYWDFFITQFDPDKLHLSPGIIFWKLASLIQTFGFAFVMFTLDKKALKFKFKGVLAYLMIVVALIQFFYPVNSAEDFEFISSFGFVGSLLAIFIPIIFIYIGTKTRAFRKGSYSIALGTILYTIGAIIIIEMLISSLNDIFGVDIRIIIHFLALLFKISGLTLVTYGVREVI